MSSLIFDNKWQIKQLTGGAHKILMSSLKCEKIVKEVPVCN